MLNENTGPKVPEFLRWTCTRPVHRNMIVPVFEKNAIGVEQLAGHRQTSERIEVLHLIGWGSTKDKAEAMADRRLAREKRL